MSLTTNYRPLHTTSTLVMPILALAFIISLLAFYHPCLADQINGADGSFEAGLGGYNTQGQVSVETALGPLSPTDGNSFALLTTAPDEGATVADADASALTLPSFQIPEGVTTLVFDVNFLTNELTPTFTNDFFTATLTGPGGPNEIKRIDTFSDFSAADGTGYRRQTGFLRITADVSQFAGGGNSFSLEFKVSDFGDGRRDSAALLDNIKLTPQLASIAVNIPDPSIGIGAIEQLSAAGVFNDGSTKDFTNEVTWASSRSGAAPINAAGQVLALSKGTTEITASKDNITSPGELLTVTDPQVVSITIAPTQAVISLGETQQYTAIGTFTDGSMSDVTNTANWTSSITNVATINNAGLASGVADGRTDIRAAQNDGASDPALLWVTKGRLETIDIEPANPVVPLGGGLQLTGMGNFSDGTRTNITFISTWQSSNPATAPVDENGVVTGLVLNGTAVITATNRSVSGNETVTVGPPALESIETLPEDPFVTPGGTLQLSAVGKFTDGTTSNITTTVTWTSSDTAIATIDANGLVTGISGGATDITAEKDGIVSAPRTLSVGQNLRPTAIAVPWVSTAPTIPHDTYDGKTITLKGIARDPNGSSDIVSYQWDFGDGAQSAVMAVSDPYALEATHSYTGAVVGTPFTAVLTVWDNAGESDSDEYNVISRTRTFDVEVNIAIDEALWFLHKRQFRETRNNVPTGRWGRGGGSSTTEHGANTGASVAAFENNGHLPGGDDNEDPYVETAQRGINWLLDQMRVFNISAQTHGNPDVNGNGIGLASYQSAYAYEGGQSLQAIAGSGDPTLVAATGNATWVKGRTYGEIVQDMADLYVFAQADSGSRRGGWRYSINSDADTSAVQWVVIGLEAAERNFAGVVTVPDFARTELDIYLKNLQNSSGSPGADGGFGYTASNSWLNVAKTGAGIASLDWLREADPLPAGLDLADINSRIARAEDFVARHWNASGVCTFCDNANLQDMYSMWGFTKGARDAEIDVVSSSDGTINIDWYQEYARWLIDNQLSNGSFPSPRAWQSQVNSAGWPTLRTAWGVLILTPTVVNPPPVAIAAADPTTIVGQDDTVTFSHDKSFHQDPRRTIVLYEWDFDGDGTFDFQTADRFAKPTRTYNVPAAQLPKQFSVTLRVTDDNQPALKDTDIVVITVTLENKPPIADVDPDSPDTDPEYAGVINQIITLDGSTSFDLDEGPPLNDSIVLYEWDLDDSDGLTQFTDATGPTTTAAFSTPGDHGIGLRVTDSFGLTDTDFGIVRIIEAQQTVFDLSIRNRPKNGKVDLVWSQVKDAPSYNVFRSTVKGGPYTKIGSTTSSFVVFVDRGLANEQSFFYVVRSVDPNQIESLDSNEAKATPTAIRRRRRR